MAEYIWTEEDLARLKKAYARGVRTVEMSDGRRTEFASMEELWKAITRITGEATSTRTVRQIRNTTSKGL